MRVTRRDLRRGDDHASMELSPSLRSSILYVPSSVSGAPLNVVPESVICVVVVDLKTIGPFERTPDVFDGIEYEID